jgi:ketosteroid isomerase-like protein
VSNEETVRGFIAALGRADTDGVLAAVAEDFELTIHTAPSGVPRHIAGKDGLAGMVGNISRTWTTLRVPRVEVHALAGDPARVLAEYDVDATNHDGSCYRNGYIGIATLVDGRITRLDEYYDPEPMVRAIDALRAHVKGAAGR